MGPVASLHIRTQLLLQYPRVVPSWTLNYYTLVSALVCQAGPRQSQQAVSHRCSPSEACSRTGDAVHTERTRNFQTNAL